MPTGRKSLQSCVVSVHGSETTSATGNFFFHLSHFFRIVLKLVYTTTTSSTTNININILIMVIVMSVNNSLQ